MACAIGADVGGVGQGQSTCLGHALPSTVAPSECNLGFTGGPGGSPIRAQHTGVAQPQPRPHVVCCPATEESSTAPNMRHPQQLPAGRRTQQEEHARWELGSLRGARMVGEHCTVAPAPPHQQRAAGRTRPRLLCRPPSSHSPPWRSTHLPQECRQPVRPSQGGACLHEYPSIPPHMHPHHHGPTHSRRTRTSPE